MIDKFIDTVNKHDLFKKNEGIVVGVSGGPDSICLLHLLWSIQEDYNLKIYVVHLNHQFRGIDANKDSEYVRSFCNKLNIPVFIYSEDVAGYAQKRGMTAEEAGRELRYKYFHEILNKKNAQRIAVAQNMNDQAETVLMRLMRGAGIEGLSAIEYKRDDVIIRPLLDIERKKIEKYCEDNHLNPRIDKTNLEAVYTRNRIRLELIPYMEKYFNKNIKTTLCRTANLLKEDSEFLNMVTDSFYDKTVRESKGEIRINKKELENCHIAIKNRILRKGMRAASGELRDVESKHIEILLGFIHKGRVGSEIDLPNGMKAVLEYGTLVLKQNNKQAVSNFEYKCRVGESIELKECRAYLSTKLLDASVLDRQDSGRYKKHFDFNKLKEGITIRNRRNGDVFTPLGMEGSKKLKDFFIDEKVPRNRRDEIPLVCDGEEIMWIVGYRISNKYKIDNDTQKILEIEFESL